MEAEDIRVRIRPQTVATDMRSSNDEDYNISETTVRQALHERVSREKSRKRKSQFPSISKYRIRPHGKSVKKKRFYNGGEVHLFKSMPSSFKKQFGFKHRSMKMLRENRRRRAKTPTATMMRSRRRNTNGWKRRKYPHSAKKKIKRRRSSSSSRKFDPFKPHPRPFSSTRGVPYAPLQDPIFRSLEPQYTSLAKEIEELNHHIPQRQVRSKFEDVIDCPNLKMRLVISKRMKDYNMVEREKVIQKKMEREDIHRILLMESRTQFNPLAWLRSNKIDNVFLEDLFSEYLLMS